MPQKIHFLSICGVAMATLAVMMKKKGYLVSGSDAAGYPPMLEYLQENKIPIKSPYKEENLFFNPDWVVIGNALSRGNKEVEYIMEKRIPFFSMSEVIKKKFLKNNYPIVITGTHGKTTTASLLAYLLDKLTDNTGFFIGGASNNFSEYGRSCKQDGGYFVIEGDEYDTAFFDKKSKFFHYAPQYLIVNNIELDHVDIFRDIQEILQAFLYLTKLVPPNGWILANIDDKNVAEVIKPLHTKLITFGFSKKANYQIVKVKSLFAKTGVTNFSLRNEKRSWNFSIPLIGEMNVYNAAAAIISCLELGFSAEVIQEKILSFKNAKRRLELKTNQSQVLVFDDFAHHPTAIKKTLQAVRETYPKARIFAIYEPRSNTSISNTHQNSISASFKDADCIYFFENSALKKSAPKEKINLFSIAEELKQKHKQTAIFQKILQIEKQIISNWKQGDIFLFLSQSSLENLPARLAKSANEKYQ